MNTNPNTTNDTQSPSLPDAGPPNQPEIKANAAAYDPKAAKDSIEALIKQRKTWENGAFAEATNQLYALLAECLRCYCDARSNSKQATFVKEQLTAHNIKYTAGTSLALRIIRLVFIEPGMEDKMNQRAYAYARVIQVAAEASVTPEHLANFIVERNGIDEIRRTSKDGTTVADTNKKNCEHARRVLTKRNSLAEFNLPALEVAEGEEFCVAVIRRNKNHSAAVVYTSANVAILNQVLRQAGKELTSKDQRQADIDAQNRQRQAEKANREAARNDSSYPVQFATSWNGLQSQQYELT